MNKNWLIPGRRRKTTLPPYTVENVVSSLSQVDGWGIKKLHVPDTWKVSQGKGKVALVIDTGFSDHIDLEAGMDKSRSRSFINSESYIDDKQGHSTHVCGIIGARNNSHGMVGVAPLCTIITAKALDRNGTGSMKALERALQYAVDLKPDIVSMSLGAPQGNRKIHSYIKQLYEMNIPVVCAAGNSGRSNDVNYPAAYPETIAVTAFDENGRPARFNSTGSQVDVAAPGVNIYSTWTNGTYSSISGTSMACPFVTGVLLLLLAKHEAQENETGLNDCKTVAQIKQHLQKYSTDKGVIGKDSTWGYGMINPEDLILSAHQEPEPEPPESVNPTPVKPRPPKRRCFLYRIAKAIRGWF